MATINVTFGGKPCYIPGPNNFELGLGISPSRGSVTMKQTDVDALTLQNTAQVLVINDGQRTLTIRELYVTGTESTAPVKSGENMVTVRFEDKRSFWRFRNVAGQFNKLEEDGVTYRVGTAKGLTPFTFDELLKIPLAALGVNITPATGITWIPENIDWQLAPAGAALAALLSEVGFDIALKPDGTFELIDLRLAAAAGFSVPSGLTELARTKQRRDVAHTKPKTARIGFRIVRTRFSDQWEPVLQDDGEKRNVSGDASGTATPKRAIWRNADVVLQGWGSSLDQINRAWYAKLDPQAQDSIVNKLGGGDIGASRWRLIKAQLYRYWRFTDTNRPVILPLLPIGASQNTDAGHIAATGSWCFLARWHVMRRDNGGLANGFFRNRTGAPPWQVRIVDARDGVVGFIGGSGPLAHTKKLPGKPGLGPHDFGLEKPPKGPSILIAFHKKVVAATTGGPPTAPAAPQAGAPAVILNEADYFFVTKAGGGSNNGETKTFLADHTVLRQTLDRSSGTFVSDNESSVKKWGDAFLTAYFRQFDVPDPEEVELAGVDPQAKLDSTARAIAWDFANGVTSRYRLNIDRSLDRFGLGRRAREKSKSIAVAAESEVVVRQSGFSTAGGGGGGGPTAPQGPFGGTPPGLVDYVPERSVPGNWFEYAPHFLNDELAGLLVAVDHRMGTSGKSCRGVQITQAGGRPRPGGQVTKPISRSGVQLTRSAYPDKSQFSGNGMATKKG